ncbi:MAG: MFS transporter, partial [Planctomycetes bacterium]|nr:MFS transporter [Planctomycetota bacterium]
SMAGIQIISGRISDALDVRKPLILIGMMGGAACSASYSMLESFIGLLGLRILQGACMGITFPPLMAIIARHAPAGRGGRSLGVYSTIRLLGFAGGPILGAWISGRWGHQTSFWTSAALLTVSVVTVIRFVPEYKDGIRRDPDGQRSALPPIPFDLRLLGSTIFLMMVGISAMISLFPTYQRQFGATEEELGLVFSAFIGTRFLLQYPLGLLGDRHDKKWVLAAAMVLLAPCTALQGFADSLTQVFVLRVLLGVAAAAVSVSVNGIAAERSEPGNRARAMGINTFSFSLGVACGPLLTGFVDDARIAFAVPAIAAIAVLALVLIRVPSDRRHRAMMPPDLTAEHFA